MSDSRFEAIPAEGNTLRLIGELDMSTVDTFKTAVAAIPASDGSLTLDLTELSFIDSCGLHAFFRYAQSLNGAGPLVINNTPAFLRRPFEIVGLDKHEAIRLT